MIKSASGTIAVGLAALALAGAAIAIPAQASASSVPCWTSFDPASPNGAPMSHYYRNCASTTVGVCPAVDYKGRRTIWWSRKRLVFPNEYTRWFYDVTTVGAQYTTVGC